MQVISASEKKKKTKCNFAERSKIQNKFQVTMLQAFILLCCIKIITENIYLILILKHASKKVGAINFKNNHLFCGVCISKLFEKYN